MEEDEDGLSLLTPEHLYASEGGERSVQRQSFYTSPVDSSPMDDESFHTSTSMHGDFSPSVAVLAHGLPNTKPHSKCNELVRNTIKLISFLAFVFVVYMNVITFITSIVYSVNILIQVLFRAVSGERIGRAREHWSTCATTVLMAYTTCFLPMLIYEMYHFARDSWTLKAQYRELGARVMFTGVPQRVLPRWYRSSAGSRATAATRHAVVRAWMIAPPVVAASALTGAYWDVGLAQWPAWYLWSAYLCSLALGALWLIIGYVRAVVEDHEYYLWLGTLWRNWAIAHYKVNNDTMEDLQDEDEELLSRPLTFASAWKRGTARDRVYNVLRAGGMCVKKGMIVCMALMTPISFHYIIWIYRGKKIDGVIAGDDSCAPGRAGGCGVCVSGAVCVAWRWAVRLGWALVWAMLPLVAFNTLVYYVVHGAGPGTHVLAYYWVTLPVVGVGLKKLWLPRQGAIWPALLAGVLFFCCLFAFGALLVASASETSRESNLSSTLSAATHRRNFHRRQVLRSRPGWTSSTRSVPSSATMMDASGGDGLIARMGPSKGGNESSTPHAHTQWAPAVDQHTQYQLCRTQWHGMGIVDFALFSYLAYYDPSDDGFKRDFMLWFNQSGDWTLRGGNVAGRDSPAQFFEFYSASRNVSVVSIRGTATINDALEDMDLWTEAFMLQVTSLVFPFVFSWPESATAWLVQTMNVLETALFPRVRKYDYFHHVERYVRGIRSNPVVLTGHSLGGSIAKVVGGRLHCPAITYCAPGATFSRMKFGISLDEIQQYAVTIKPIQDIVSSLDKLGGTIQYVPCTEPMPFPQCHLMKQLICKLTKNPCGVWEQPPFAC